MSDIQLPPEIDTTDLFANPNENAYNVSKFGVLGLKHNILLGERSYVRTVLSASYSGNTYTADDLQIDPGAPFRIWDVSDAATTFRLSSYYNLKVNNRLTLRTGLVSDSARVTALVDLGVKDLNRRTVIVPLRAAQSLQGLPRGLSRPRRPLIL